MILYLYRKEVVWIVDLDWCVRLMKVLILVWFDDIGGDIWIFSVDCEEVGILLGFGVKQLFYF